MLSAVSIQYLVYSISSKYFLELLIVVDFFIFTFSGFKQKKS